MVVGDFNDDGNPDVLLQNAFSPSVTLLLGNGDGSLQTPVTFDPSLQFGEEKWLTKTSPTYTVQAKVTVSIINGVDLPISVSWANRTELIKEADINGRFGFTFDVAKLMKAFK